MSRPDNPQSVTVVVTRKIVPGRDADYRRWTRDVGEVAAQFPGHIGSTLQGPTDANEYHVIFRFDTIEHLRAWETSQERADWTSKLDGIVEGATRVDEYCGLEFLFEGNAPAIPRYRMAIVLTLVVFLMLLLIRPVVAYVLAGASPTLQLLCAVVLQVSLMTYIVMPFVTRALAPWLTSKP